MELTTHLRGVFSINELFMMSKIQNLNGTHNSPKVAIVLRTVIYDIKDTKFEWN